MADSLLDIVTRIAKRTGVPVPTTVVGNTDTQVCQIFAAVEEACEDLHREYDWQELKKEHTFTTVATQVQFALSTITDFDRICPETMFNRTDSRQVRGPLSDTEWQQEEAYDISSVIDWAYRIRGGDLLFSGSPSAGETVAFEYVTSQWCQNSAGDTYYTTFQADTDEPRFSARLVELEARWRFLDTKGADYAEVLRSAEKLKASLQGQDKSTRRHYANAQRRMASFPGGITNDGNFNV